MNFSRRIFWVSLFAVAFAFVESSVVVYLRALYYPEGFTFPLKLMSAQHVSVELARELSTIVMLAAVGMIAGSTRWNRFAYFAIAFGVWDIFYYVWMKLILDWPATLLDWDILFLIPVPWIGPVIAPVIISLLLIAAGWMILRQENAGRAFKPSRSVWLLASAGTVCILLAFTYDLDAALRFQMPKAFPFKLFSAGILLYVSALWKAFSTSRPSSSTG